MKTTIYLVRHCEATGQEPKAILTEVGKKQASALAEYFTYRNVKTIISSPWTRAVKTIEPLARQKKVSIKTDERLQERILSSEDLIDWYEKLGETFKDYDLSFSGGESSRIAQKRVVKALQSAIDSHEEPIVVVTHGNLLTLLLNHYDKKYGFKEWEELRNPDVFVLTKDKEDFTLDREGVL
ncbi:histidine phosphatase family protein [Alteribacter aurantiacus]|uniref:histidine phosphatase family protein n=1 Tax=Alteribacter aurantiacus TaxID=254410 RepID=UPI000401E370|nr:histidine phosphatase family protein [Alteribacter aurantiacus]